SVTKLRSEYWTYEPGCARSGAASTALSRCPAVRPCTGTDAGSPAVCVSNSTHVTLSFHLPLNSGRTLWTGSSSRILPSCVSSSTAVVVATPLVREARSYTVESGETASAVSLHSTRP